MKQCLPLPLLPLLPTFLLPACSIFVGFGMTGLASRALMAGSMRNVRLAADCSMPLLTSAGRGGTVAVISSRSNFGTAALRTVSSLFPHSLPPPSLPIAIPPIFIYLVLARQPFQAQSLRGASHSSSTSLTANRSTSWPTGLAIISDISDNTALAKECHSFSQSYLPSHSPQALVCPL
jgi:hypothetical protein